MNPQQQKTPIPGVMIGITHDRNLTPIIREPRVLKVGIGVPKGRACYVYTHQGFWIIRYGEWAKSGDKDKLVMKTAHNAAGKAGFSTRAEAEDWYAKNKQSFAVSNRPQKLQFFTFTRRTVTEVNNKPEEIFEPDFAAIEANGDTPRVLDIVFMGENPLGGNYQAWSASELRCYGDGATASRVIQMGSDAWPGWKEAKDTGQKRFSLDQCWESGKCPYAQDGGKDKLVCKPNVTLSMQLANDIRLGSTAYFVSTGFESVKRLFSSIGRIQSAAEYAGGSIVGVPMKLILSPFKTNHNGISAIQFAVSVEMRDRDVKAIRKALMESSWSPRTATAVRLLESSAEEDVPKLTAAEMTAEFYPQAESDIPQFEEEDGAGEDTSAPADAAVASTASAATATKTEDLKDKLKGKQKANSSGTPPPPTPPPPTPPPPTPAMHDQWRERAQATFFSALGAELFAKTLVSVTGTANIESITTENYRKVWDAMERAKPIAPKEEAPKSGVLF